MPSEHTFYDYFDADGSGSNIIKGWLNNGGKAARARFINRIELLSASCPGGMELSVWKPPFVKPLIIGKWKKFKDFIEIRVKESKIQYRLIGKKVGREIFLVSWGFHDGKGWRTDITPATAQERATQMMDNPAKYRRGHEL
jgi:hypothetical protein